MESETIAPEQIKTLKSLFDPWDGLPIRTDEDYQKLGEVFSECNFRTREIINE